MEREVRAGKGGKIARKQDIQLEVYEMLKAAIHDGVQLYMEGEPSSPESITQECCLNEESIYMPDYVTDGEGKLVELHYDKINFY
ncbi:MAG: hypothetical protein PHE02_01365 [Lachnospiraceae bacterium]|nr:hypothetical protein [Lachnospiraceae bacterium]